LRAASIIGWTAAAKTRAGLSYGGLGYAFIIIILINAGWYHNSPNFI